MTVVCDTSPLLVLAKVGRLELLTTLYDAVWVPSSVVDEITAQRQADTEAIEQWRDAHDSVFRASDPDVGGIPDELGAGEGAAIALAIAKNADLVVLDDQKGRRVARARGLEVTGTIGVLVEARERGHISSFSRELDRVVEAGLWISESMYDRLIQEFEGE